MPYIVDEDVRVNFLNIGKEQARLNEREAKLSERERNLTERERVIWSRENEAKALEISVGMKEKEFKNLEKFEAEICKERKELNDFKVQMDIQREKFLADSKKHSEEIENWKKEKIEIEKIIRSFCDKQEAVNFAEDQLDELVKINRELEERIDKKATDLKISEQDLHKRIEKNQEEAERLINRRKSLDAKEINLNDYKRILDIREGEIKARENKK